MLIFNKREKDLVKAYRYLKKKFNMESVMILDPATYEGVNFNTRKRVKLQEVEVGDFNRTLY